jgi:hypothetical protein
MDIAAAADLVDLSIQDIWVKSPADQKEYHKDFVYVEPVSDYIVKDSSLTSVRTFSKVAENGQIPAASPNQGFKQTYTQSFFSGMLRITRAEWRYALQARKLEGIVTELRNDAVRFKEQVLANMVNNMTSTAYTETTGLLSFPVANSGGDGLAPQSASHTREDGGPNWSNVITDGTTNNPNFDYAGWKAALKTAQAIRGGVGEVLDITLDNVLVKKNSSAHFRAQEVVATMKDGNKPSTANREAPISQSYEVVANPFLTSDTAWSSYDSGKVGMKFGFQVKEGMPLNLDPQFIDYDTKEIKYSAGEDFAYGFNDLRNFVFSTGLNS